MAFGSKSERTSSLRYFVYVSDGKIEMLMEQIGEPARRSIAAELKLDLKLVSLTLTSAAPDRSLHGRSRMAKLAVIEAYIRRDQRIGDLSATHGYLAGEAEMDWKPCDDNETVLFCGYREALLLVLGGSISNLLGRPSSAMQIGSHPYTIQAALRGGGEHGNLGVDLLMATRAVHRAPQPLRFLARVISRGPLRGDSECSEYLLATPLYVEAIDTISA